MTKVDVVFTVARMLAAGFTAYEAGVLAKAMDWGGLPAQLAAGAINARHQSMTMVELSASIMDGAEDEACHGLPELESVA